MEGRYRGNPLKISTGDMWKSKMTEKPVSTKQSHDECVRIIKK